MPRLMMLAAVQLMQIVPLLELAAAPTARGSKRLTGWTKFESCGSTMCANMSRQLEQLIAHNRSYRTIIDAVMPFAGEAAPQYAANHSICYNSSSMPIPIPPHGLFPWPAFRFGVGRGQAGPFEGDGSGRYLCIPHPAALITAWARPIAAAGIDVLPVIQWDSNTGTIWPVAGRDDGFFDAAVQIAKQFSFAGWSVDAEPTIKKSGGGAEQLAQFAAFLTTFSAKLGVAGLQLATAEPNGNWVNTTKLGVGVADESGYAAVGKSRAEIQTMNSYYGVQPIDSTNHLALNIAQWLKIVPREKLTVGFGAQYAAWGAADCATGRMNGSKVAGINQTGCLAKSLAAVDAAGVGSVAIYQFNAFGCGTKPDCQIPGPWPPISWLPLLDAWRHGLGRVADTTVLVPSSAIVVFAPTIGHNGTCVREPALVRTLDAAGSSVLLAFAHRRFWQGDGCNVSSAVWPRYTAGANRTQLVMRRSTSGGASWLPEQMLDYGIGAATVVDATTGAVIIHYCAAQPGRAWPWASDWCMHPDTHGTMFELRSTDGGRIFTRRHIGPSFGIHDGILPSGHGMQVSAADGGSGSDTVDGGRLVMVGQKIMNLNDSLPSSHGVVWGSDNHGGDWRVLAWLGPGFGEPSLASLGADELLLSMRDEYGSTTTKMPWACGCRLLRRSKDRGSTWGPLLAMPALPSPGVMGSILAAPTALYPKRLLLSFPYSRNTPLPGFSKGRGNFSIHTSLDGAASWSRTDILWAGPAGYSSLASLGLPSSGGCMTGVLYERSDLADGGCVGESCIVVFSTLDVPAADPMEETAPPLYKVTYSSAAVVATSNLCYLANAGLFAAGQSPPAAAILSMVGLHDPCPNTSDGQAFVSLNGGATFHAANDTFGQLRAAQIPWRHDELGARSKQGAKRSVSLGFVSTASAGFMRPGNPAKKTLAQACFDIRIDLTTGQVGRVSHGQAAFSYTGLPLPELTAGATPSSCVGSNTGGQLLLAGSALNSIKLCHQPANKSKDHAAGPAVGYLAVFDGDVPSAARNCSNPYFPNPPTCCHNALFFGSIDGVHWQYRGYLGGASMQQPTNGPGPDGAMVELRDGRILAVFRQINCGLPLTQAWSATLGQSWTKPRDMVGIIGTVGPQLLMLPSGLLLMVSGRPGIGLAVALDAGGEVWQSFNIAAGFDAVAPSAADKFSEAMSSQQPCRGHPCADAPPPHCGGKVAGEGTSYVSMVAVADANDDGDTVALAFDRFNGSPNATKSGVYTVRAKIVKYEK